MLTKLYLHGPCTGQSTSDEPPGAFSRRHRDTSGDLYRFSGCRCLPEIENKRRRQSPGSGDGHESGKKSQTKVSAAMSARARTTQQSVFHVFPFFHFRSRSRKSHNSRAADRRSQSWQLHARRPPARPPARAVGPFGFYRSVVPGDHGFRAFPLPLRQPPHPFPVPFHRRRPSPASASRGPGSTGGAGAVCEPCMPEADSIN